MTTPPPVVLDWHLWAPPLDPPVTGGLPADWAQQVADDTWAADPHLCAALQWEAYAAMLPPTPAVSSVNTGAQSVAYSPATPTGDYGLAIQRAEWHRSWTKVGSVPMVKDTTVAPVQQPWWVLYGTGYPPDYNQPVPDVVP
jgi:hypothetical protein